MSTSNSMDAVIDNMDFAAMLEASFEEDNLERGDIVKGEILSVDNQGLIVGVGSMHDGFVSRRDLERLGKEPTDYEVGSEVDVTIVRMEDEEGNLVLSVSQARQSVDWERAENLLSEEEVFEETVADANRGGLIIAFGNLRGFVPASHVADLPRGLNEDDRINYLKRYINQKISLSVIEVNRKRRRLVFSQREAERGDREARKQALLEELAEGETRKGIVSGLRDFGAFVDLGGADGLIHISELAWHRVKHPREILNVGDEVEVYILRLDDNGKRIGLSLKRLQPNPWSVVDEMYHVGQLVSGTVSRLSDFGVFISMEPGIEALLHISQIADPTPAHPSQYFKDGDTLLMRVISIESDKQRLGLSLKDVTLEERNRWEEQNPDVSITTIPQLEDNHSKDLVDTVELEAQDETEQEEVTFSG